MTIHLTKDQCKNVAEFIDMYLLHAILTDTEIDNLNWVRDMIDARDTMLCALEDADDE